MRIMQGATMQQLLLLLSLAPWLLSTGIHAQQTGEQLVTVRTGQELADAVAAWGASGSNTTIQIGVPFISVRNATFQSFESIAARTGTVPFSRGKLIIRGLVNSDGSPATVLDAGMRQLLTDRLSNSAAMMLTNIVFMNLCEFDLALQPGWPSWPYGLYLFNGGPPSQTSRTLNSVTLYARQDSIGLAAFILLMGLSAIPDTRAFVIATGWVSGLTAEPVPGFMPYSASVKTLMMPDIAVLNATIKAVENPDDPLVAQWRAQGVLMPPQMCLGRPVVDAPTQRLFAPFWISVQPSTFASNLEQAAAYTATPRLLKVLPVSLMLGGESVTVPDTATYQISSRLVLASNQYGYLPSWDLLLNMNLNRRVNLFNIAPGADVIIQWLGLTGLAVQVPTRLPPSLAGRSPDTLLPSVFPLAAFNTSAGPGSWKSTAQVKLINVTLAIPPDEYMALFILTSKQGKAGAPSCADPTIIQRVDQLQAGISTWAGSSAQDTSLEQHLQQQTPQLFLELLTGWGFNATQLRLVPTSPLVLPACSPSQQSGLTRPQVIGLAVGLACGLVLLVGLLVLAHMVWRRRRAAELSEPDACAGKPVSGAGCTEDLKVDSNATGTSEKQLTASDTLVASSAGVGQPDSCSPHSSLHQFVLQAQASQVKAFASLVGRPDAPDGHSTASKGSKTSTQQSMDQQQLQDQVAELAAKLQQQEGDQLLLAGVLGSGSGGTVYMGLWRGLRVAVKTVIFHDASDRAGAKSNERVILEAAICASLGHKNVVATYHYDIKGLVTREGTQSTEGLQIDMAPATKKAEQQAYKLFLVQELCNTCLDDALHAGLFMEPFNGQLDLSAVLSVMLDIASGLEYLHSKGIIHGDLKPENVLLKVDQDASAGVVAKLTDFGLSTKLQPGRTHVSNYRSGTPFYVAPEVAVSHQASPASDMYGFGVMCWQLFMQQPPYKHTRQGALAWDPLFPHYPRGNQPPLQYLELSRRCLQHDPHLRPTPTEAVSILSNMLQALP